MALAMVATAPRATKEDREAALALAEIMPPGTMKWIFEQLQPARCTKAHGDWSIDGKLTFGEIKELPYVNVRTQVRSPR